MRPPRRRAASGAAAALLLATVAAACGGHRATATPTTRQAPPAAPPTTAPPTTAPPTTVSPAGAWTRVAAPSLALGGGASATLAALLPPDPAAGGWLVAGSRSGAAGTGEAVVWTSADATTWTATALTGPGTTSRATAATRDGQRTVVVGSVGAGDDRRAAVWVSAGPGQAFTEVADQAAFAGPAAGGNPAGNPEAAGGAEMDVVGAGALGVFAAGTVGGVEAMWYSTDGHRFTRLAGAERVLGASTAPEVRTISVTTAGVFAAGSRRDGASVDGAVWTSTDGLAWGLQPDPPMVFSGSRDHAVTGLADVARLPGLTFVAVGATDATGPWAPVSWLSPDGRSWSSPAGLPAGSTRAPGGATAEAVAATPTGFVAVGGGGGDAAVWSSTDGRTWTQVPLPAGAATASWHAGLVASDGTTTLVADPDPGQPHLLAYGPGGWRELSADASTWGAPQAVATPASLRSDASGLHLLVDVDQPGQLLGQGTSTVVSLSSPDGTAWTAAPASPAFAGGAVLASTGTGLGAAAVGSSAPPGAGSAAQAWASADGSTWAAAPAAPGAFGPRSSAAAITRLAGGRLVAAGSAPLAVGPEPRRGAVAWVQDPGGAWAAAGPLDGAVAPTGPSTTQPSTTQPSTTQTTTAQATTQPVAGRDAPLVEGAAGGACSGPRGAVVVGDAAVAPRTSAVAWTSATGAAWRRAAVPPAAGGASSTMIGCSSVGHGLVAWGSTAGGDGSPVPALWSSADGSTWTSRRIGTSTGGNPAAVVAVATSGSDWLAVGGAGGPGPAGGIPLDPAGPPPGSAPTGPTSGLGVWRSGDGGTTWTRVATGGAVWAPAATASARAAAWLGGTGVVAGTVDGELAVWVAPAI